MVDFNQVVQKAKEFAGKNPDKVREGIEKAEGLANAKTGGKFGSQIESAGEQIEKQLGVPAEENPATGEGGAPTAG